MNAPHVQLREVADGVFAHVQHDGSWWINSSGVVVRDGVVVVIDSCATRERARGLRARIREVETNAPQYLINTHAHGDHTYGNDEFGEATIIAHHRCRSAMIEDPVRWSHAREWWSPAPQWTDLALRLPDLTIDAPTTLWCADREIEIRPTGQIAHTDHDLIVVLDEVAFVGDLLFNGGTPLFVSGSVLGYLGVLPMLRALAPRVLVPGHGEPCGHDEVDAHERYVRMVLASAEEGIYQSLTPLEVAREIDLGEFSERTDSERIVLNLHRAYADLVPHRAFDLGDAFADAMTFHGGPLRTHV